MTNSIAPTDSDLASARAEMDRLLTFLVQSGSSDIHLRVGQPPILRKQGEVVIGDGEPMEEDSLRAMLKSIMSEKDVATFDRSSDIDYA